MVGTGELESAEGAVAHTAEGCGRLERILLSTVSKKVASLTPCPVMVVS